jgi:hypothetical protein
MTESSYAPRDHVLIAVVAEPRPMGLVLAGIQNGWSEIRFVSERSQLTDKVRIGDIIERVNNQDVIGWRVNRLGKFFEELYKTELQINVFFLRTEQAIAAPPGNAASVAAASCKTNMARTGDPEVITPPAKRIKQTPKDPFVASLRPSESITPSITLAPN